MLKYVIILGKGLYKIYGLIKEEVQMFKKQKSTKILAFFIALILILPLVSYSKPVNVLGTQTEESTANITKTAKGIYKYIGSVI